MGSGTTTCSSHLINERRGRRHVDMGVSRVPGASEVASGWTWHRRVRRRIAGRDVAWSGEWQWPSLSVSGHSGASVAVQYPQEENINVLCKKKLVKSTVLYWQLCCQ